MNDINIINGTIISSEKIEQADIAIKSGRIVAYGSVLDDAIRVIDAAGMLVMPGMIDSHLHIRGGALSYREDFRSGSIAAAAGGVTSILEMPIARPSASTPSVFRQRAAEALSNSIVNCYQYAGAGADNLDQISELAKCGAIGYKTFLMPAPMGREDEFYGLCSVEKSDLIKVMKEVQKTGKILAVHAEDSNIAEVSLKAALKLGKTDLWSFESSRPKEAELKAIETVIEAVAETGCKTIICHVSTADGIEKIVNARNNGFQVYAETCPQYLTMSLESVGNLGAFARVKQPIRSEEERSALLRKLSQGNIDVIGSDHAPYTLEEKMRSGDDVFAAFDGMPGLELSLRILLSGASKGWCSYPDVVRITSETTAKLFGLYPQKGRICKNADADIVIVRKDRD